MSKATQTKSIVVSELAEKKDRLTATAMKLRPDKICVPLGLMRRWYMMDRGELVTTLQEEWGERAVLIENKTGYLLWIKCTDTPPPFLLVHHIDTVQPHSKASFVPYKHDGKSFIHSPHNDDRLGVATALATLPSNGYTNYDILITDEEEVGKTTAIDFMAWVKQAENGPEKDEMERINGYRAILEFDRGGSDWVTYGSHNQDGYDFLVDGLGWAQGNGSFSDIKALQGLGVFTINFGTGYQNSHSANGYTSIEVYAWCVANAIAFMKHFGGDGMGKLEHKQRQYAGYQGNRSTVGGSKSAAGNYGGAENQWKNKLASTRPMINATMIDIANTSYHLTLQEPSGDYCQPLDVQVRLLKPTKVERPTPVTNCSLCGSKTATMGEMQYGYNAMVESFIVERDGKKAVVTSTRPVVVCEVCYQVHRDRSVRCVNHYGSKSIYMAPPTPLHLVVPGENCTVFCECKSGIVPLDSHKVSSIRVLEKGKPGSSPILIPRNYSELVRFSEEHPDLSVQSYLCDSSDTNYPLVNTGSAQLNRWWARLLWGEGSLLGMVSSVEMKKKYGDAFHTDWFSIASNPAIDINEYLMTVGELQRDYEGRSTEQD